MQKHNFLTWSYDLVMISKEKFPSVICFSKHFLQRNLFNLFMSNVPILYPLKAPKNQIFKVVFRGFKMGALTRNGLIFEKKSLFQKKSVHSLV